MNEQQEITRANRAREVLENPLMIEAMQVLRDEISGQWTNTAVRDTDGREQLWLMQRLLARLETHLRSVMTTGSMAKEQLRIKETMAEKARRFMP
jgi:predicted Ser/Thr protein kinase